MYGVVILLHSWLRWEALMMLVLCIALSALKRNDDLAKKVSLLTFISFHTQLLLGLILYAALSPVTKTAFADFGAAMKDSSIRFFAVEHIMLMLIAVVVVSVGHIRAKKATDDLVAARRRMIFMTIGLLVTMVSIPWPGMAAARPLFRF